MHQVYTYLKQLSGVDLALFNAELLPKAIFTFFWTFSPLVGRNADE